MSAIRNCEIFTSIPMPAFLTPAACSIYDSSGSVWPAQPFPSTQFLTQFSHSELRDARAAWNLFEQIESQDAATRVRLAAAPHPYSGSNIQTPHIWYVFKSNEERLRYLRGKALHSSLCPEYRWVSQRDLGITAPPVNVYPILCSDKIPSI
jgi:hypothetical protein